MDDQRPLIKGWKCVYSKTWDKFYYFNENTDEKYFSSVDKPPPYDETPPLPPGSPHSDDTPPLQVLDISYVMERQSTPSLADYHTWVLMLTKKERLR